MDEETYLKVLEDNPLLPKRPDLITCSNQNTRDFKFDETGGSIKLLKPKEHTDTGFPRSLAESHQSIYFEAYGGDEEVDVFAEKNNLLIMEEEYKGSRGSLI
jgi:hypothetical protein